MSEDPKRLLDPTSTPEGFDRATAQLLRADLGVAQSSASAYDAGAGLARLSAAIGTGGPLPTGGGGGGGGQVAPLVKSVGSVAASNGWGAGLGIKMAVTGLFAVGAVSAWVAFHSPNVHSPGQAANDNPGATEARAVSVVTASQAPAVELPAAPSATIRAEPSQAIVPDPAPTVEAKGPPTKAPAIPSNGSAPSPSVSPSVALEMQQLADTRAALGSDPGRALQMAEAGQAQFPKGIYGQEREVSAIVALAKLGRMEEARQRAAAFIAKHPESPFAESLRSIVGGL